jgi:hypothetical protein
VDLAGALRGLGERRTTDDEQLAAVSWFEVGPASRNEWNRGPDLTRTRTSKDPVLRLRQALRELGDHFPYARAVTFGNRGGQ